MCSGDPVYAMVAPCTMVAPAMACCEPHCSSFYESTFPRYKLKMQDIGVEYRTFCWCRKGEARTSPH